MDKVLLKGNEAVAEGAIRAGCRFYAGYPITPQSEMFEYLAKRLPEVDGVFLQAESEVAGINYLAGGAAMGMRALTSSSGPGMSLMQEGISYMAAAELPAVIVNISRGGPGLGRIAPSQSDYLQTTKGGGHGDYKVIALAPKNVKEMADFTYKAFDLADKYRTIVMILADGLLGQMAESISLSDLEKKEAPKKDWALSPKRNRPRNTILSAPLTDEGLRELNFKMKDKYELIKKRESDYEYSHIEDAELVMVAFGTTSRFVEGAVNKARQEGLKVGLIRPITLWPFPDDIFNKCNNVNKFTVVEMNMGQMIEDVKLAVNGKVTVDHLNALLYGLKEEDKFSSDVIYDYIRSYLKEGKDD